MLTYLKEKKFPSELKLTNVINLYKKGETNNPTNYRQISLIPLKNFGETIKSADGRLFACKKNIIQQTILFQKYSTVDALV